MLDRKLYVVLRYTDGDTTGWLFLLFSKPLLSNKNKLPRILAENYKNGYSMRIVVVKK